MTDRYGVWVPPGLPALVCHECSTPTILAVVRTDTRTAHDNHHNRRVSASGVPSDR